jgi:hypothetical protein
MHCYWLSQFEGRQPWLGRASLARTAAMAQHSQDLALKTNLMLKQQSETLRRLEADQTRALVGGRYTLAASQSATSQLFQPSPK